MNTYANICSIVSMSLRMGGVLPVRREAQNLLDMRAFERYVLPFWQNVLTDDGSMAVFFNAYDTMKRIIARRNPGFEHIGIDDPNISALIRSAINFNDQPSRPLRVVFDYIMAERFGVDAYQQQF